MGTFEIAGKYFKVKPMVEDVYKRQSRSFQTCLPDYGPLFYWNPRLLHRTEAELVSFICVIGGVITVNY